MDSANRLPTTATPGDDRFSSLGYQLFILGLSVYAILSLVAQAMASSNPELIQILQYADIPVCALFFIDFLICYRNAPDRTRYLMGWGILDLLSCIPALDFARWGRVGRMLRIFRVLRGLRAGKVIVTLVLRRRAENTLLAALMVSSLLIIIGSVAILGIENQPESNIKSAEDALWWAFATIMTVGYGDRFPVTSEGRFVAGILMMAGLGLFGTFSAYLAAMFLQPEAEEGKELVALRNEVQAMRALLETHLRQTGSLPAEMSEGSEASSSTPAPQTDRIN